MPTYRDGEVHRLVPWLETTYGLIGAAYGPGGHLGGLRARWVALGKPPGPKEISPYGRSMMGLVYADTAGRSLLSGRGRIPTALVISEGLPDTMVASEAAFTAAPGNVGAWGIWSGSLRPGLLENLPRSTTVYLAFDPDKAGRVYTKKWGEALAPLVRAVRVIPLPRGKDLGDLRKLKGAPLDLRNMARASVRWDPEVSS